MEKFAAGSLVDIENVGIQTVVLNHGAKLTVENENGARALVDVHRCTPVKASPVPKARKAKAAPSKKGGK